MILVTDKTTDNVDVEISEFCLKIRGWLSVKCCMSLRWSRWNPSSHLLCKFKTRKTQSVYIFFDYFLYIDNEYEDFKFIKMILNCSPSPLLSQLIGEEIKAAESVQVAQWSWSFPNVHELCIKNDLCDDVSSVEYTIYGDNEMSFS